MCNQIGKLIKSAHEILLLIINGRNHSLNVLALLLCDARVQTFGPSCRLHIFLDYCKIRSFQHNYIFAKLCILRKSETLVKWRKSQLFLTGECKSCPSCEFLTWQICLLTVLAKIILMKISEFTVCNQLWYLLHNYRSRKCSGEVTQRDSLVI